MIVEERIYKNRILVSARCSPWDDGPAYTA